MNKGQAKKGEVSFNPLWPSDAFHSVHFALEHARASVETERKIRKNLYSLIECTTIVFAEL